MARAPSPRPDSFTLRQFLLGRLSGPELEAVERYLRDHPLGDPTLNAVADDDTLVAALRQARRLTGLDTPELAALTARVKQLAAPPAGATAEFPPPADPHTPSDASRPSSADGEYTDAADNPLSLLAPPEGPGELGRVGGYRVLRQLGRGGMGVVYEAEDGKLGRTVALKVMAPALAARPAARERFVREARAQAAVEHDHIVPIYHVGEDRGVPYIAMPLLRGETLDDRLRGARQLPPGDVLRLGREVAEGLSAAHAAGLIHRDVKPSNVWLEATPEGVFKHARLLDFGLAKVGTGGPEADAITHSGAIVGTPAYMAPEQARGETVDHRADLFSLGCVLYQMATGRRPFPGVDTYSVLTALATVDPPAPTDVNPRVPPPLSNLIVRLLAKDAAARPASARAVADALAKLEQAPPPAAAPPAPVPAPAPVRKRRRGLLAAAAAAVLALAVVGAYHGKTIVRVANNEGELVVEVDDPNTVVVVKGGGVELRRTEDGKQRVYLVKATKDGEVEIREPGSQTALVAEKFQLKRGGDVMVRVTAEKLAVARKPKDRVPPSIPQAVAPAPAPVPVVAVAAPADFHEAHGVGLKELEAWAAALPAGYRPVLIAARSGAAVPTFDAVARPDPIGKPWRLAYLSDIFDAESSKQWFEQNSAHGYGPVLVTQYKSGAKDGMLEVFQKDRPWRGPWGARDFVRDVLAVAKSDRWSVESLGAGQVGDALVFNACCVSPGGGTRFEYHDDVSADELADRVRDNRAKGWRPRLVSVHQGRVPLRFAAVFEENAEGDEWEFRPGLTAAGYEADVAARKAAGFTPRCVYSTETDGQVRYAVVWARPAGTKYTNALGMEFALVPKGKGWLGGGGGRPGDREVEFREDFYLGVYGVTQGEWAAVTGASSFAVAELVFALEAVLHLDPADAGTGPAVLPPAGRSWKLVPRPVAHFPGRSITPSNDS